MKKPKGVENVYMNNYDLNQIKANSTKKKLRDEQADPHIEKSRSRNFIACLCILMAMSLLLWVILGTVAFLKFKGLELEKKDRENLSAKVKSEMELLRMEIESACTCYRCQRGWDWIEGSCYFFSTDLQTWANAKQFCSSAKSLLLTLQENETTSMQTYLEEYANLAPYWIGLTKDAKGWTWIDGTPVNFSKWAPGEPNGANNQHVCVEMRPDGNWNDHDCFVKRHWICKKKLPQKNQRSP